MHYEKALEIKFLLYELYITDGRLRRLLFHFPNRRFMFIDLSSDYASVPIIAFIYLITLHLIIFITIIIFFLPEDHAHYLPDK